MDATTPSLLVVVVERNAVRVILTERNSTGMPPLIKSGGVLASSNASESTPRVGDDDGARGGEEKVGRLRCGDEVRLDLAELERRVGEDPVDNILLV